MTGSSSGAAREPREGAEEETFAGPGLGAKVRQAVVWRSGAQAVAQLVTWASTFIVIRLLDPSDYGLFAMTQVVLVFLNLMNGYGFANALVRAESATRTQYRQVFGMLLLLNGALAAGQLLMAPVAAAYFRQPMVADLLRVQALLYLATPFLALPHAILGRRMEFRLPAQIQLGAAAASAATAVACAWAGWGVWTLVAAPFAYFYVQAIGLTWAARAFMLPSFRFAGAGPLFGYGWAMILVQFLWFVQAQADVFIAGRALPAHDLGLYTTSLFLTQILAAKFVPPLNEVAFAAYSRLQGERGAVQTAFLKSVRLIMLVALPFYFGLAVTAEPFVLTFLGDKWAETVALVPVLALAMPLMTLQILFAPATNAIGRPGISVRVGVAGALLMPPAFLAGVQWGPSGLAAAWLGGMAVLLAVTARLSLPAIGVKARALAGAVAPGFAAAAAMAAAVAGIDSGLPPLAPAARLAVLVPAGAAIYGALLFLFAREAVDEVLRLVRGPAPAPAQAV
jgi:O-antigen/teichoic acid export membrane protein